MNYKCRLCGCVLIVSAKHKIGYRVYKCEKCGQLYYVGDTRTKLIVKDGVKYLNLVN